MDPEQIILDEDFDDGSTDGGYGEYDYLQQDKDALPVTPLDAILDPSTTPNSCRQSSPIEELPLELSPLQQVTPRQPTVRPVTILPLVVGHHPQHRFGVGSGKPSAAALRRGPGRPKKDFLPSVLLKMASTNPSSSPSAAAGGPAGPTLKFSGGVLTGSGQTVVSDAKLMKRKSDSLGESLALVLPSPDESLGGGGGGGPSTASSSVATTPTTAEMMETDPALLMPAPEESPYFPEKYPGKVCALCALGERSQLGQGEMLRIEVKDSVEVTVAAALSSQEDGKGSSGSSPSSGDKSPKTGAITLGIPPLLSSNKRQKGLNKCKNPVITAEYVDELEKIGHTEPVEFASIKDGGYFYIHRSCASWSFGVGRDAATGTLSNLEVVVAQALSKKCYFCSRYGASLVCKMSCPKSFHYPCIAAAGGFQVIQSYNCFCKEHLGQVPLVCTDDINCRQCSALGDVGNLMMCSICGDHYHGTCVGLAQLPGVRSGWQCGSCKKCQICRVPDSSEGRTVGCEQCDKIYHASCLRPIMTSIPKYGWKCRCCRICSDCGSRTPGAGASSRWHAHFSVCDSCYQQRNKGFSCPICHRAYRAAAHREMVKCSGCNKFVHSTCDAEADLSVYHAKKETNPDYEYLCSPCKTAIHSGRMAAMRRNSSVDDDSMSASQESLNDESMDVDVEPRERIMSGDIGLGKGKPYVASKIAKKRLGLSLSGTNRPKGTGKGFQKKSRLADFSRKRGPKAKMRGIFGVPGLGLQRPTADSSSSKASEEEPGGDNRLVLCSAKDKFVLTQDICVMCGAIGTDQEGCLIACTQCGQCYHPYCTNVKVTKVILQKGWRCLDCTICEGCGQRNDEGRLILCDDCDISYHTYCMDPPLEQVPQGNWKCKWCAICLKCGTNDPGYNCAWLNNYSECGPCASQVSCPCCGEGYADGELIIQCNQCERWLHCGCDQIKSENEAERCAEDGYNCLLCRPHDQPPPHLVPKKKLTQTPISTPKSTPKLEEKIIPLALEGNHYVDGVCLSEHGLHQIKSLQAEFGKRGKRKPKLQLQPPPPLDKDDGILAAIESVVAGSSLDNSFDDVKLEPLDPREEAEIYKDGMVWNDPVPPEGFALVTNEQGVVVLRKKRQRNLQKLGIGGFFVRNRAVRTKDGKEEDEIADGVVPQISEESATSEVKPKKKPIRRKQKNKLIEIYPTILQDAFFGRPLLNSSAPTKFETQESDDDAKSDVSDDKTIKLTADELKYVEEMRIKQEEKQAQEQKALQQSMEQEQAVAAKSAQPATASTQQTADEAIKAEEDDNSDTEALKDVLGLPNDLIEEDFVNRIMNDDEELTKTSAAFDELTADGELGDGLVKATKNELDILSPDFNLDNLGNMDSKEVEEIFKNVMTDESQESQESMFANSMTPYTSNTSTPSHSIDVTKKALPQRYLNTMAMQQHSPQVQQPQQQPPTPTSGPPSMMGDPSMQPQVNLGMQSPQTPQQQQMMNPMGMPSPHIHQSPQHQPMGGPGPTMMIQSPLQQQPTTPGTPIHTMQTTPTTPQPQHMQMMPTPPQQQQQQMQPNMSMLQQQQQQMVMNQQQQQLNRGYYSNNFLPQRNQFQQLADPMQQQQSLPPHQQPQQQQQIVTQQIIPGVLPHQQLQQQQQQQPQLQPGTIPGQIPQSPVQGQWVPGPAGGGPMGPMGQSPQQQQLPIGSGPVMGMVPAPAGQVVVGTSGGTAVGGGAGPGDISGPIDDSMGPMAGASAAQKMSERMRLDEPLNELATISSVLYCNTQHPELKLEFPNWADRCKQIFKRWRLLSTEQKQPYLQQARDNRSAIRMKKSQQVPPQMSPKDGNSNSNSGQVNVVPSPSSSSSSQPPQPSSVAVVSQQQQQQLQQLQQTDPNSVLLGVAAPGVGGGDQLMTNPLQQQQQHLQMQLQQQVLKPQQPQQQQQQQLIEVQGNSLDDGTDSLDELTSASNSNAISALLDSNTTPSPSNDTNTLDSLIGEGSNNKLSTSAVTTSTSITTTSMSTCVTTSTNPLVLSGTMSDNATSNVISPAASSSSECGPGGSNSKPNLLVAANIANTFINLASVSTSVSSSESGVTPGVPLQTQPGPVAGQPVTTHVMKTFTIGTNRGSIFVPNVIATNISPHFTVHHHQYGLRNGPAPNVTVNPNGNFNTNSSAVIRPGFAHIRPFLPQNANINFNIIGNQSAIQSPILAASLQTINKIAQQQQQHVPHPLMPHHHARGTAVNKIINVCPSDGAQKILLATTSPVVQQHQPPGTPSPSYSPQRSQTPNLMTASNNPADQQIRVLTPSEIMRTLPSLDAASYENANQHNEPGDSTGSGATTLEHTGNAETPPSCPSSTNTPTISTATTNSDTTTTTTTTNTCLPLGASASATSTATISCSSSSATTTTVTTTVVTTTTSTTAPETDQDKINAQQKSMREAEQERQWKQLQQQRAREQQTQQHLMMPDQRMQDPSNPSLQLQVSTDGSPMGPTASPSPTRTQFVSPVSKNRMVPLGGQNPPSSPVPNFQHPAAMGGGGRPGMQIPLQQQQQQQQQQQRPLPGQQQRPNQSPFSPQSQPPQSPHEMLPGSPASQSGLDPFARPPSEGMSDQNYIHHSPQTPRSVGHQSPIQTPNRSPAYSGQPMPNPQTAMRINLDAGYAQAPGTPRPQFSNQVRPTVYARPGDLFGPVQTSPFTSPRSDGFNQPQPQEGNRQLRDLLQRQQVPASGPGVVMGQQQQQQPTQQSPQPMQPQSPYGDDQQQQNMGQLGGPPMQTQQTLQQPNQQMMQMTAPTADNGTFRQPLPPNMMNRPRLQMPGGVGGIRAQGGPGVIPGGPRLQIVRTGGQMVITQQNILQQQQLMRQRMQLPVGVNRPDGPFMSPQGPQQMMQQQPQLGQQSVSQTDQQNIALLAQRLAGEGEAHIPASTAPAPITSGPIAQPQPQQAAAVQAQPGQQPAPDGSSEIPDSVSAELEKLEQEDNAGIGEVEGVGDIFGGLADDDDELLDSLTAEMGADFNILEYADPELDTTDGEKSNLLDSLELDEPEGEKAEDKAKAGPSGEVKTEMMDTGEKVEEQKPVPMGAPQEMVQPAPQLAGPMMQGQMPLMQQQQQQMQMQPMQQQQQVPQGLNPQQASQLQQLIGVGPGQQMQQQQMQGPPQQLQQQLLAGQMKTVRPNMLTAAHLQQIQQQMQQQVQQAAAMGKPMAVGTQLLSKEGAVGVVTANNNVSVTVRTGLVNPSRIQQLKMGGHPGAMVQQNMMPGQQQQQQQRIVQQIQGNRIIQTVANPNQPVGPVPGQQQQQQQLVGVGGQSVLHQQLQQPPVVTQPGAVPVPGQQQPPPPPYPEPPPPYPGSQPGALGPPQQQQQPNQHYQVTPPPIPPLPPPPQTQTQPLPTPQPPPPPLAPPQSVVSPLPPLSSALMGSAASAPYLEHHRSPHHHHRRPLDFQPGFLYPGSSAREAASSSARRSLLLKEQRLLLEDLLEQEKREQAGQLAVTEAANAGLPPNMLSQQDFENLLANQQQQQQQQQGMRVIQQNLLPGQVPGQPGQMQMQPQQLPPMQQQQPQQPGQLQSPMGGQYIMQQQRINPQWRPQTPIPPGGAVANLINPLNKAAAGPSQQIAPPPAEVTARPIAVYQANLQPAPPVPPENITNEQERQIQLNYENWMNQQKISLENQLKHYETEIGKLRKVKKQLNTKQRQLKKAGNELSEPDMKELTQITADHAVVQKQLDNARKQQRQHTVLIGEYKTKQQAKMQAAGGSPAAQIAPPSPLMSPSPSSQQNMIHQPMAQSPLNNPMLQQPSQSPLHSPGPLMSQSPGPASVNSVMQSPGGNHTNSNSAMSPYNTMQQSPRIGTPHSQAADENPFSPGPSPSPSLPGRLTSPAPRMTSPQHRMSGQPMPPGRMVTSPGGQYVQQNIIVQQNQMMGQQQQAQLQQQNRFVRPQIIPNDPNVRMRVANSLQQQQMMQQNANIRQMQPGGYNSPIGSPQPMVSPGTPQQQQQQQQNIQLMQQQQRMIMIQNQQQQMNQMQQQQQQQMNQMQQQQQQNQQQLAQMQQPNQQQMNFAKQSPVHQPPSPLLSQGGPSTPSPSPMPPSPMYYYQQSQQQQQQQQQQMQSQQQQMIRRPPSAGSQGPVPNQYVQQQQQQQQQQYQQDNSFNGGQNNQQPSGGGGGGGGINNPSNPIPIMPGFGKYGYIKLGLRGGSPMWGNARITKGPPQQQQSQQQPQAGPSQQQSEAAKKAAMMRSRITIVQKAAPSQATPIEEVIAVDSSPDEKQQRMLDYDDEVDKRLVTTEVSLSSVAQGAEGDDIMESFAHTGYEMRASPLGAQIVSSDYELFAQDVVVDCVDNGKEGEKEVAKKTTKDGEKGTNERNIATTEDFEAMIDSRPKDADGKPEEDFIGDEQAKTGMKTPTKDTTVISVGLQQSPKPITYPGRIAIQQTLLQNRPPIVSAVHKKLVKDATETTAKLSIGNTTISVPILKSFPMSATPQKEGGQSQQKQQMSNQAKKVMNSTAISLSSITKNPSGTVISVAGQKINTTSIVTLSSLNLNQSTLITKTFARTSVNNPHPSSSTASQIKIQPVQSITPGQSSQMEIIKSAKPKAPSPSLGYAKLSSLTVTQDTSLPTKIFEDDSVSPDSSIGQEDADQLDKVDSAALDDATRGIDGTTEGDTPTVIATVHEGSNDSHSSELKKQGVIPVHVISKSRENSKSPILGPAGQRVISSVPQLSPLSQPNELTMNAMNVSQQVRSIMSSVNPATSGTNIIQVGTSKQELTPTSSVSTISTISFDTVIPGKGDNMSKPETIASILKTVSGKTILPAAAVANASNKPELGQQQGTMAGGPTKLLNQQLQIGRISPAVSSAGNNILVVKQVRAPLQKQLSQSQVQKQQLVVLAAQQQQQQQQQLQQQQQQQQQHIVQQGGVIIQGQTRIQPAEIPKSSVDSSSTSSIASILSSTLQQPQTRIVNFSEVSTITSQPPPGLIMTSRPGVISSATSSTTTTSILSATLSQPMKSSSTTSASMSTLLQNQLQGPAASFRRSKSTDEAPAGFPRETPAQVISKRLSLEASNPVKMEPVDNNDDSNVSSTVSSTTGGQGCKFSTISSNVKTESDSQNVLLKQLLQNTGTGGTTSSPTPPPMARPPTNQRAPSLGVVSSLEAQLARPVIPPSANPPAMQIISTQSAPTVVTSAPPVTTEPQQPPQKAPTPKLISRETSFVSKPAVSISASHPTPNLAANMLAASIKKEAAIASAAAAAAGTTVQPITVQSTLKTESGPMTVTQITTHPVQQLPPQQQQQPQPQQQQFQPFSEQPNVAFVKREMAPMPLMQMHQQQQQQSVGPKPLEFHQYQQHQQLPKPGTPVEIKKELPEEQHQQMPMASMPMEQIKQEPPTTLSAVPKEEPATIQPNPEAAAKTAAEIAHELKKKKRREYQKNRRQQQILSNKEQHQTNKKKPRKSTRQEEDYDTYIDSLMLQLRQLPPMQILEPLLPRNFGVCPLFGTGDLTKFTNAKDYSISSGDLTGVFGHAQIPNIADFYNTKPFGLKEPPPEPPAPASTQRGFYDQEFPPIKFETEDRYRYDFVKDRDLDSPDTIISTSSPECGIRWESPLLFPGLRVIKEEDSEDEQTMVYKRMSPIIPIVAPIPIRLKKGISLSADRGLSCLIPGSNKENEGAIKESLGVKSRFGPPTPLKDSSNVTVTVTLSSTAAEDIMGVLRDLANILEIPPPMAYEIVERTTTPPSQKLGLYRTKGRDGKEGAPIDIQTILNGAAKFCRHCDVVILNTLITAKPSEFPLLSSDASQELESEELYFCSKACYRQFQWRPTNILEDKLVGGDKSKLELDLDDNPSLNAADIKQELSEDADISMTSFKSSDSRDSSLNDRKKKLDSSTEKDPGPPPKQLKGIKFKTFSANCFPVQRYKKPTEKEITETLFRMSITVTPTPRMPDDTRRCIFCHTVGDGVADGPSRLLNYDVDKWVHLNCALWSDGVYETVNGALMNLENTLQLSLSSVCTFCNNLGATIKCFKTRCASVYHLSCAMKDNCVFYKNKSTMCQTHAPKTEKDSELTTLSVQRRVYVDRDESRQVASVMHHSESNNLLRVGSLIFLSVGQLLPHQLQSFHTPNYIYPIGYKIMRFYWSMRRPNKRCRYVCSIADVCGRPEFRVLVQEASEEDIELRDITPKAVWQRILDPMATLRKDCQIVQLFPRYISGEDLFGLTEPAVVRILESLPGIETLTDYRFKYGRNPLLELPLAINPSGAARTEPKLKHTLSWKKPHTQRTGSVSQRPTFVPTSSPAGEVACPYSKQFVHSKSSQYKKMKLEWRNNVFLARSKIQGLGLYAARDLEKHTMVIEYIGEVIRVEVSELREKQYEARNRGIYMFRLDEDRVVDATLSGGLARYINHSCNPNCVTEIVEVEREVRIIIFAKRRINRGEELSYDYKFDIEDDAHKISCMCGAPNCKKWMN